MRRTEAKEEEPTSRVYSFTSCCSQLFLSHGGPSVKQSNQSFNRSFFPLFANIKNGSVEEDGFGFDFDFGGVGGDVAHFGSEIELLETMVGCCDYVNQFGYGALWVMESGLWVVFKVTGN
ncbi:hypothetical protein LINPERHAP2_LOCUS44875 [Linum perenne]